MPRQEKMTQMKEQNKASEKIQLSDEEIANLSDAQFKTLVMLTELVEYGRKIEGKVKTMKSEIKENAQGTNSDRKESGNEINDLYQKEEINIRSRMKKQEFKKTRRGLGTSTTSLNVPTSESGVPEGEEEAQEIGNLFAKIMENFPNLAEEIDFQEVQEAQSPKEAGPKEEHTKAHHNYITQDETEGENLRRSKRKGHSYLQGLPIRLSADFSKETL